MHVTLIHSRIGGRAGGGGGPRLMFALALHLKELGHEVVIVCHDHDPRASAARDGDIEIRSVRQGSFSVDRGRRAAMRDFWLRMPRVAELVPTETDVVNAHEWPALHAARLAADRIRAPFVWTRNDHTIFERALVPGLRSDVSFGAFGRALRAVGALGDYFDARRAAAIVTLDRASREAAERAYRRPASTIHCGPFDHFFVPPERGSARRSLGAADSEFVVLGVGIMAPHRRFEDLIDAISLLRDIPKLRAHIIGSDHVSTDYADFLELHIADLGLEDRIRFARSGVTEDELRSVYVAADLFVFPNDHRQSWGLAPLEALASGTPVVVTTEAGITEILRGRDGVTVVPARSPSAIAAAIREQVELGSRQQLEETRQWMQRELSVAHYAREMVAVYSEALASTRSREASAS